MSFLRKWSIARLVPAVAVVLVLASALAVAMAFVQRNSTKDAEADLQRHIQAQVQVDRFAYLDATAKMLNANSVAYPQTAADTKKQEQATVAEMGEIIQFFESVDMPANERAALVKIGDAYQAYVQWGANIDPQATTTAAGFQKIVQEYTQLTGAQTAATTEAQKVLGAGLADAQQRAKDAVARLVVLVFVLAIAGGLILTVGFAVFGRQLIGRLDVLASALRRVAAGDLTVTVDASGRDEVASMAADVNALTDRLRGVFSAVGETNGRLLGASNGLEDIAGLVGRSADEASSRAEVVARSADEVSQNVQAVASGSEEMGASISEIAQNANEAARVATGAVQAVESTTGTMNKLGDSSREIGDVVRLITSIAEQTNLLALNATIEAARAGDAGKGFAVVADEVKQLAQETARATEDISRRVETIQEDADQAARAIADIAGVITRINEFQTTIASAVEEQTATTQAINAGVTEAASGSNQIAQNIAGVADAAGQTATSMTRAKDSARELAGMSAELARLVAGFRF
jgi:methyl-accepting chemotaxis protein